MNWGAGPTLSKSEGEKSIKQKVSHKKKEVFGDVAERLRPILKLSPELCALSQSGQNCNRRHSLSDVLQVRGDGMHWGFPENGAARNSEGEELEIKWHLMKSLLTPQLLTPSWLIPLNLEPPLKCTVHYVPEIIDLSFHTASTSPHHWNGRKQYTPKKMFLLERPIVNIF